MPAEIEELALSVARGFEEVRQDVNQGFADLHQRLDRIESKVTGLAGRVEVLEGHHADGADEAELVEARAAFSIPTDSQNTDRSHHAVALSRRLAALRPLFDPT